MANFRVDLIVNDIGTATKYPWSYYTLLDNLGGNHRWVGPNTISLAQILPGETRAGYVLFPALNPNASAVTLVVTEFMSPENIVYQFQVNI